MIYKTFNLKPRTCISVSDKNLPPVLLFNKLVVACPNLGFLVLAPTAIPINGAVPLIAGFRNLFQAVCVPSKFFEAWS